MKILLDASKAFARARMFARATRFAQQAAQLAPGDPRSRPGWSSSPGDRRGRFVLAWLSGRRRAVVFESLGVTDRGLRRHHNEDQFLIRDDLTLYVVADGMGGHAAGEVAADLAVREVERVVETTRDYEDATWPEDWDPRLTAERQPAGSRDCVSPPQGHRRRRCGHWPSGAWAPRSWRP